VNNSVRYKIISQFKTVGELFRKAKVFQLMLKAISFHCANQFHVSSDVVACMLYVDFDATSSLNAVILKHKVPVILPSLPRPHYSSTDILIQCNFSPVC